MRVTRAMRVGVRVKSLAQSRPSYVSPALDPERLGFRRQLLASVVQRDVTLLLDAADTSRLTM